MTDHANGRFEGNTRELRKFLVAESPEAFGNVPLTRSRCITKLVAELETSIEFRPRKQFIDPQLELTRALPRTNFRKVPPSSHAAA